MEDKEDAEKKENEAVKAKAQARYSALFEPMFQLDAVEIADVDIGIFWAMLVQLQ